MSALFRKLSQKRHWDAESWLEPGDIQADAAKCLATSENKLSVFVLEQPDEQVERVVAALAVTRDSLAHLDTALAPEEILARCGIRRDEVPGQTADFKVNEWHQDLVELTVMKVARFAAAIRGGGEIKRCNWKKVGAAIRQSLNAGYIGPEHVNGQLFQSLKRRGIL